MDSIRSIVHVLRTAGRNSEQLHGLTAAQLFVLQTIGDAPGVSVNGLAELTHTDQSSVSVVVQKLVDKKLVERSYSPTDRRRAALALLPAATAVLKRTPDSPQQRLISAISSLSNTDLKALARLLGQVVKSSDATDGPPPLFFEERVKPTRRRTAK